MRKWGCQWGIAIVALLAVTGDGWLLGGDAAVGVPMPANLSHINTVNTFQEETESTLHQEQSVGPEDSSR